MCNVHSLLIPAAQCHGKPRVLLRLHAARRAAVPGLRGSQHTEQHNCDACGRARLAGVPHAVLGHRVGVHRRRAHARAVLLHPRAAGHHRGRLLPRCAHAACRAAYACMHLLPEDEDEECQDTINWVGQACDVRQLIRSCEGAQLRRFLLRACRRLVPPVALPGRHAAQLRVCMRARGRGHCAGSPLTPRCQSLGIYLPTAEPALASLARCISRGLQDTDCIVSCRMLISNHPSKFVYEFEDAAPVLRNRTLSC